MYIVDINNFPINSFPPQIRDAVLEVRSNTQFPLPLIASSALGTISAACQNFIDVQPPIGSVSPVSLFILLIAESGEGKTPTDQYFTKPIREFEKAEDRKIELTMAQQAANMSSWEIERNAIENAIKKNRKKSLTNDAPEQDDRLNEELDKLQKKLLAHLSTKPQRQRQYKLFYSNTTPIKLLSDLHENLPTAYLSTDEAGSLFRGEALKDLGMLNKLWDGSTLEIDRKSSPSFKVQNARLSMFLAVQPETFQSYIRSHGKGARDIGFLARCLVTFPFSTKGSRILNDRPQFSEYMNKFQQRITDILGQDCLELGQGRQERLVLKFSEEAKQYWYNFRNKIEYDLNPGRYLSDIDDFASKIAINLARMAALFHFFDGQEGDISLTSAEQAGAICNWYINESKRLFSKTHEIPLEISDTSDLEQFLLRWSQTHIGQPAIAKSLISQYGPNQLRPNSNKARREYAINQLIMQNKIAIQMEGKKKCVVFNKNFFPCANAYQPYLNNNHNNYFYKYIG